MPQTIAYFMMTTNWPTGQLPNHQPGCFLSPLGGNILGLRTRLPVLHETWEELRTGGPRVHHWEGTRNQGFAMIWGFP